MDKICSKTNRHFLMGVSIVAILICHITQFADAYKGIHSYIGSFIGKEFFFASAAIGVDVFFFLSLVGLGYSFEKSRLVSFYRRRVRRIFPIYLTFLVVALVGFYHDISSHEKIVLFLQQISGVSALETIPERIEWYVPSLLILYALYPLVFLFIKRVHKSRLFEIIVLFLAILVSYPLSKLFVGLFAMRLPLYYIAILSYFYIKEGQSDKLNVIYIIAASSSFFIQNVLISYALIIPLFLYSLNPLIERIVSTRVGKSFSWIGNYTLEVYLAQVIATKYLIQILPTDNIILIILVVFASTAVLSYLFNIVQRFYERIIEYLKNDSEKASLQKRISWVDAAKGLAMLIIIWGHVQSSSPLKNWLTSFHVPLFLVLTGVLISPVGKTGGGKRLIHKLLRPYITFSVIAIVCSLAYHFINAGLNSGIYKAFINIYKTITGYGIGAIWFIPSYFIAYYAYNMTKNHRSATNFIFLLLWGAIGIGGSVLFSFLRGVIENDLTYQIIYYPICSILRGLACTFFLVLGSIIYEVYNKIHHLKVFPWLIGFVSVICLLLNVNLSQLLLGTNFSLLQLGDYPYMSFVCGTLGSISIIGLFYLMRHIYISKVLQFIGRKSLIIMGTHMSLLLTLFVPEILSSIISMPAEQTGLYYLFGLACVVLILIVELPVISLLDGKMSFLIRKPQN